MAIKLNRINKFLLCVLFAAWSTLATIFFFIPIRNAGIVLPVILGILFLLFYARSFIAEQPLFNFDNLKKSKRNLTYLFALLFSFALSFSLKGSQLYLLDNSIFTILIVYLGTIFTFFCMTLVLISILLKIEIRMNWKTVSKWNLIYYAIPSIIIWLLYWIAFYPAAMTPDSLNQWEQAHTYEFNDWHPVMYTWFIMVLVQIWDSPAIVSLVQILINALIFGYVLYRFEVFGVKKKFLWVIALLFAISPVNGIFSIHIWKDVLYGGVLLLFTMLIMNIVSTKGKWLENHLHILFFLITSLAVSFMRHNGFPVFIVSIILLMIFYRKQMKSLAVVLVLTFGIHWIITGPVYTTLEVIPSEPNEALSIPTQQIATILIEDGELTDEQLAYFDRIFPIELWKERFHPYNTNDIKFSRDEYDREFIFEDFSLYLKNWLGACIQNPDLALKAFFVHTSLIWQINEPEEPGYTDTYVTNIYYGNKQGLVNTVISPFITKEIGTFLAVTKESLFPILWRPATYLFALLLFTFIAYLRNNHRALLISFPIWINTAAVWAAMPAQDFRYLYINTLFIYLAFIFMFLNYKKSGDERT